MEEKKQKLPWYAKLKLNALQGYIMVFFAIALILLLASWFFQARENRNNKHYQNIIDEQQTAITTNNSMIKDLQTNYLEMQKNYDAVIAELASKDESISTLQSQVSDLINQKSTFEKKLINEEAVSKAYVAHSKGQKSVAKAIFDTIDTMYLSESSKAIYNELKQKLN